MIADTLKELRARKGLTREAAAEKIGISARTLANYERGERIPQGEILTSIADFYGVSREELLLGCLREREGLPAAGAESAENAETAAGQTAETQGAARGMPAGNGGAAGEILSADIPPDTETDTAEAQSASATKARAKRRKLRAWVVVLAVLGALILLDLALFFIENLPVENGDSALGIVLDWRNLGIALLVLLFIALAAFGICLAVRTRSERPRRMFALALCLLFAGMAGAGSLSAILCRDCFFAPAEERRGFAVWLRLDLQGDYDGSVTAQATNNFAVGFDAVQLRLTLYYSAVQTNDAEDMTAVQTVFSQDLDIFQRIEISAPAADGGYWRAELVYRTNGSDWQQLQTDTLYFDERASLGG